jgi:hypothetical protein
MTFASIPRGLLFPAWLDLNYSGAVPAVGSASALNTAAQKYAMIGRVSRVGRGSATISAAGGGSLIWRSGVTTWANAASAIDIGLQGVSSVAGPVAQPDGTYTVKKTQIGADGSIGSVATVTTSMTGGTGTATLTHGDFVSVVWDLTAVGGADSVVVQVGTVANTPSLPVAQRFASGAWSAAVGSLPNVVIVFDDGSLGTIDFTFPITAQATETFADATNPDERGQMFQLPWNCKVDGLWMFGGGTDTNSDFTIALYGDPLGTPAELASVTVLGEHLVAGASRFVGFTLPTEVTLLANTDYAVAIKATGSTNARLTSIALIAAGHRALFPGGTTLAKVTRNGGAGAFTAESTPLTMYMAGVRVSAVHSAAASGYAVGSC